MATAMRAFIFLFTAIDEEKRLSLPIKKQLDILLVRRDQAMLHGKKTKKLRIEISRLKRYQWGV